jgi:hypothetical protein
MTLNIPFLGFAEEIFPVATQATESIPLPPEYILLGIGLIIATFIIILFLKKIIINSILGVVIWGLATYLFNVSLPTIPSLIVSIIFGPAGIGVMLVLKVFGLI